MKIIKGLFVLFLSSGAFLYANTPRELNTDLQQEQDKYLQQEKRIDSGYEEYPSGYPTGYPAGYPEGYPAGYSPY